MHLLLNNNGRCTRQGHMDTEPQCVPQASPYVKAFNPLNWHDICRGERTMLACLLPGKNRARKGAGPPLTSGGAPGIHAKVSKRVHNIRSLER